MKKKGCLGIFLVIALIVIGVLIFGYLNRHKIFACASEKLGLEAVTILENRGTKVQSGLPPGFLNKAYRIDLPEGKGTFKIASVSISREEAYSKLVEYYESEGWKLKSEADIMEESLEESLEEITPVAALTKELEVAELEKGGKKMRIAVSRYGNETLGIVWKPAFEGTANSETSELPATKRPTSQGKTTEPETVAKMEKLESVDGADPEGIPLYKGSVRTDYMRVVENGKIIEWVVYSVAGKKDAIKSFFSKELEEKDWEIERQATMNGESYLQASQSGRKTHITIKDRSDGYTGIEVVVESEQE
jgi:hypothetical protein